MVKYIGGRIVMVIPVLLGVTLITFLLSSFSAGDAAHILAEKLYNHPTLEQIELVRHEAGLDLPLHEQYATWLARVATGDFGNSLYTDKPALHMLISHITPTFKLGITGLFLLVGISFPLALFSVVYENRLFDKLVKVFSYLSVSMPSFWLGLLFLYIFGVQLGIISVIGGDAKGIPFIAAFVLAFRYFGVLIRLIRANLIEVLNLDFIRACRAKGLSTVRILFAHGLKNALIPVVTRSSSIAVHLIIGSAIIETIFSIKGIGFLALQAMLTKDMPVLQCYIIVVSCLVIFVNLAIDISYTMLDKRIKLTE